MREIGASLLVQLFALCCILACLCILEGLLIWMSFCTHTDQSGLTLTRREKRLYSSLFRKLDTGNLGVITADIGRPFLLTSGLRETVLERVSNIYPHGHPAIAYHQSFFRTC